MTRLHASELCQAYNRRYIFKGVSLDVTPETPTVILGANGSGKSTLLKTLAGALMPFEGSVSLTVDGLEVEELYARIALAAPYLELIEEYTLREFLSFCRELRPWRSGWTNEKIIQLAYLEEAADRELKYFSSGMKQRVRLVFAALADTPVLLLDEPTSNLDRKGIDWYVKLMDEHRKNRIVIVASNENQEEYYFCDQQLRIEDYK
jgi:ABC-type multidrug transport system ATPase subunit